MILSKDIWLYRVAESSIISVWICSLYVVEMCDSSHMLLHSRTLVVSIIWYLCVSVHAWLCLGICWSRVYQWTICLYLSWYSSISECRSIIRSSITVLLRLFHLLHNVVVFRNHWIIVYYWVFCWVVIWYVDWKSESRAFLWYCWRSSLPIVTDTSRDSNTSGLSTSMYIHTQSIGLHVWIMYRYLYLLSYLNLIPSAVI